MIFDHITNAARYGALHPRLRAGFDYIRSFDVSTADGDYAIEGDAVFARPHTYLTEPAALRRWEAHRRYVDIQFMVAGREAILHAAVDRLLGATPYDLQHDVVHYTGGDGSSNRLVMQPGFFAIFYPEDGHKPGVAVGDAGRVRKVVVKVDLGV